MSVLVSIDPSVRHLGLAIWADGKLKSAELIRGSGKKDLSMAKLVDNALWRWGRRGLVDELAIEFPQLYGGRAAEGNGSNLLVLARCIGEIVNQLDVLETFCYLPSKWTKGRPKKITEQHTRAKLSLKELEQVILPAPSLQHNVWDAIGIGLYHLKR